MPRSSVEGIELTAQRLASESAIWCRLAAINSDGVWEAQVLELTSGQAPPSWKACHWEYPRALISAFKRNGRSLARTLETRKLRLGSYHVLLSRLGDSAFCERRYSQWSGGGAFEPLPWPTYEWRFNVKDAVAPESAEELIGESAPSFFRFSEATAALLGVDYTGWNVAGREFVFRRQDRRGRLTNIQVRPTQLLSGVEGHGLSGAIVELAGNRPGLARRLTKRTPFTARFPLPAGLPAGAWLALRKREELLDYRLLSRAYAHEQPDVEHIPDSSTALEILVSGGETVSTEFKEELPRDDAASKRNVMKTVAAFANGAGGTIIFGISDEGEILGINRKIGRQDSGDRLSDLVRTWISPPIEYRVLEHPLSADKVVLILEVEPGSEPPYATGGRPTDLRYYVRRGATSFPATASELRLLARTRPPVESPGLLPYGRSLRA